VATALYKTLVRARLYNSKGNPLDVYVDKNVILECEWLWDQEPLIGKRKIVSGDYTGRFIIGTDLELYTPTDPNPDPEPITDDIVFLLGSFSMKDTRGNIYTNVETVTFRKVI